MKAFHKVAQWVSVLTVSGFISADADVIDPNYHPVDRCVTVDNLDDFPDIAVIALSRSPGGEVRDRYRVKSDSCLIQGYKFNSFYTFFAYTSYLDSVGLDNMPLTDYIPSENVLQKKHSSSLQIPLLGLLSDTIQPFGPQVPNDNPLIKEELHYHIQLKSGKFSLPLSVKTSYFEDGTKKVEELLSTAVQSKGPSEYAITKAGKLNAFLARGCLILTPSFSANVKGILLDCNGRTVHRFQRTFREAATYCIPCDKVSAGIYWLQVFTENTTVNLRLATFK